MSTLEIRSLYAAGLSGLDARFAAGIAVVLGSVADGTGELINVCAGIKAANRGQITVGGHDPYRTPALRARLGALLAQEPPFEKGQIGQVLSQALRLRRSPLTPEQVLTGAGIAHWLSRPARQLSNTERRALALSLALSLSDAAALLLHEPLACGGHLDRTWVLTHLAQAAKRGAIVLCCTASARDAASLSQQITLLDRGRLVRKPGAPLAPELAPGSALILEVETPQARSLAAGLAQDERVHGIEWKAGDSVRVRGGDTNELARAVVEISSALNAQVRSIRAHHPSLDEARAASMGLWRAAYERALQAARPAPVARSPQAPASLHPSTAPAPHTPAPPISTAPPPQASAAPLGHASTAPPAPGSVAPDGTGPTPEQPQVPEDSQK